MVKQSMEHFFKTREEASVAAAEAIAERLAARLDAQSGASVVVSGGTTPDRCFDVLSGKPLDWKRTQVVLSDERWVPPDDDASNERLVRDALLKGEALPAKLLSVFSMTTSIQARCDEIDQQIRVGPFPFACVLLGMGEDGHFASLCPDAANLDEGLDELDEGLARGVALPVLPDGLPHEDGQRTRLHDHPQRSRRWRLSLVPPRRSRTEPTARSTTSWVTSARGFEASTVTTRASPAKIRAYT